jgi:MoaA/NifB/PqqE/SkfB family radical SAM enzyme/SAM-dependent methyltransferase
MQWLHQFRRLEHAGVPVYVNPLTPDWFVPSSRTDSLLQAAGNHTSARSATLEFCSQWPDDPAAVFRDLSRLQHLLGQEVEQPYQGRIRHLRLGALKEIWFHLTDTCNLSCRHCLFAASPAKKSSLDREQLHTAIEQASALGSHLFYFTGGEPFVYPDFSATIQFVLEQHPAHHVAVLTNGMLLGEQLDALAALDRERLHLQVSLDGLEKEHDFLRGKGSYGKLQQNLKAAAGAGLAFTISVAINSANLAQVPEIAGQAHALGATGLHFMYHFVRGKGTDEQFSAPAEIFSQIRRTAEVCGELGLEIDNLETLKAQVFANTGTRFDLTNMGWESIAVAPDGRIYPSPALIGVEELVCGSLEQGLEKVWQESITLKKIRSASLIDVADWQQRPLALLTGGGDPDHSWVRNSTLVGDDPYLDLYEQLVLELIVNQAVRYPDQGLFRLRMGDVRHDCPDTENGSDGSVSLTHCNCVVSLADHDGHSSVREFYGSAALQANEEIVNPFAPDGLLTNFIPEESTKKSYGCGSPVKDAAPQAGETVVDLGSGSGVECFLAAADVGATGRVFGIDMTDDMLNLAHASKKEVVASLGYDNIEFRKGFLEDIPLADNCADVVISNCVINLSPDKRATYLEIMRILKPGGRLVIADVVTDEPVAAAIKNNKKYRGECLGGAMQQDDLTAMLEDCGFVSLFLHKRYPYRQVAGNSFYSLTYEARKQVSAGADDRQVRACYRGPLPVLATESGLQMERGQIISMPAAEAETLGEQVFILDAAGAVENIAQEACCCGVAPEDAGSDPEQSPEAVPVIPIRRHQSGCMVCGSELIYATESEKKSCYFCNSVENSNSECGKGHFICDSCHQEEGIKVIRHICLHSSEKDMIRLLTTIRSHPAVPMHGPEHHGMVPGVILAAYRNCGGGISRETIAAGIDRGSKVPGGACGFWGSCGAAIGAGIAAALILDATPLTPNSRQQAQAFAARILTAIAEITGGRCCQRETWLALSHTAGLSEEFFGVSMQAETAIHCDQYRKNRECIRKQCPLWDSRVKSLPEVQLTMVS